MKKKTIKPIIRNTIVTGFSLTPHILKDLRDIAKKEDRTLSKMVCILLSYALINYYKEQKND